MQMYVHGKKENILWHFRFGKSTETEFGKTEILYFQGWEAIHIQTSLQHVHISSTILARDRSNSDIQVLEWPTVAQLHCVLLFPD
jgi:hypothetical protein